MLKLKNPWLQMASVQYHNVLLLSVGLPTYFFAADSDALTFQINVFVKIAGLLQSLVVYLVHLIFMTIVIGFCCYQVVQ